MDDDFLIAEILANTQTIAIVGASANWKRPSFFVMKYMQKQGFRVIPVNPGLAGQSQDCYLPAAHLIASPLPPHGMGGL